jgi:hypothetical protein
VDFPRTYHAFWLQCPKYPASRLGSFVRADFGAAQLRSDLAALISIVSTSVPLGTVARAQAQGRKRVGTKRELLGKPKAGTRGAPCSRVTHRVMMRQHDRVTPIAHCDIGSQKSAHVLSCAGESPVV